MCAQSSSSAGASGTDWRHPTRGPRVRCATKSKESTTPASRKRRKIKPCHDGLPRPGGHHDEISDAPVYLAFSAELFEDLLLISSGSNVDSRAIDWDRGRLT